MIPQRDKISTLNKYVNEYVEDGVAKIIFPKSKDNDSGFMTKKLTVDLHDKHSKNC